MEYGGGGGDDERRSRLLLDKQSLLTLDALCGPDGVVEVDTLEKTK